MKNYDDFQRIEHYLEGKLTEDDVLAFEDRLKSDKEFANQLKNYNTIISEIREFSRNELKNQLTRIHYEVIPMKEKKDPIGFKGYLRVAAVILALVVLSSPIIYNKYFKKSSCEKLFTEYFEPYSNISSQRGSLIDEENLLKESAMYFYEKGDYNKAILSFEELLSHYNTKDNQTLFYYGISCLGSEENAKAIEVLNKLNEEGDLVFYEQVKWYLALAYLNVSEKEKSKNLLVKLVDYNGSYLDRANELIRKL